MNLNSYLSMTEVQSQGRAQAGLTSVPTLFFEYGWLYDAVWANSSDRKIEPAWANEIRERVSYFINIWDQSGPVLFGKVFEMFGRGFQRKEMTATLSICPAPSLSRPLILNVTAFLKSYMGTRPVRSDDSFADLVFHELLHTWLFENLDTSTPLLTKHRDEEPLIRNHLHLMAMQKYIYTELKRDDLVEMINTQYSTMPYPAYNRAWEIVSRLEGYEAFISEIKKK